MRLVGFVLCSLLVASMGFVAQAQPASPDDPTVASREDTDTLGPHDESTPTAAATSSTPPSTRHTFVRSRWFTAADDRAERARARAMATQRRRPGDPEVLELPNMPDAYFYRATQGGRRRVFVYLHARNADPRESCRQFSAVVPRFGWLLCPVGPGIGRDGRHQWNNNPLLARQYTTTAVRALFQRFPRRTRVTDNVLMGFSEGAFVAIQTGLNEPVMFPRWVIFAAHDRYLATEHDTLIAARRSLRRLYLVTGRNDEIVAHTRQAAEQLRRDRLGRVELRILDGVGHQLPPAFVSTVRAALQWVTRSP